MPEESPRLKAKAPLTGIRTAGATGYLCHSHDLRYILAFRLVGKTKCLKPAAKYPSTESSGRPAPKSKVGYETPFNRHFYVFTPPRSVHELGGERKAVASNITRMLEGLAE